MGQNEKDQLKQILEKHILLDNPIESLKVKEGLYKDLNEYLQVVINSFSPKRYFFVSYKILYKKEDRERLFELPGQIVLTTSENQFWNFEYLLNLVKEQKPELDIVNLFIQQSLEMTREEMNELIKTEEKRL